MSRVVERTGRVLALVTAAWAARAGAQQEWRGATCDLKPGHYLVNSGILYLKSAAETKFADKRDKDLHDALRVLDQALTSGGQQKNPAAWYYFGRYYAEIKDGAGADSAFTKAVALAPACSVDVNTYRRQLWVPVINAGIAAWQAGNTDSAIALFRRANQAYAGEPMGFSYLATLMANASHPDSAAKYFRLAVQAAADPKFAKDKRDALFNLARVYHGAQRYDEAVATYKEYLAAYPRDMQATAGLAAVYSLQGKRNEAMAMYTEVLQHGDSASAADLFGVGRAILNGIPDPPDTAAQGTQCRADARRASRTLTPRQVAARCDSLRTQAMRDYDAAAVGDYRLVTQAFEAGLAKAWRLKGRGDSTLHYLQIADSIPLEVTVSNFAGDEHGATLTGLFSNPRTKPTPSLKLTLEFLSAKGDVVATETPNVAAIGPGENRAFELKPKGEGIVAWRYHL